METKNLAELYDVAPMEWTAVTDRLDRGFDQAPGGGGPDRHSCWLATLNEDGSPHVTGLGVLWAEKSFWFETGPTTRKGRNLARDPRCSLSVALDVFDLVVEGEATRETDPGTVARLAALWASGGWPARVDDSGIALTAKFSAPSAGRPPWWVYRLEPRGATALQTVEPGGATRWTF